MDQFASGSATQLSRGITTINRLPLDLPPAAEHRTVEAALPAAGRTRCDARDWAIALAAPDGAVVARISPFDPVGPCTARPYREAAETRQAPTLYLRRRLVGGDLQLMEQLMEQLFDAPQAHVAVGPERQPPSPASTRTPRTSCPGAARWTPTRRT
ncbi:hypothetical protein [Tsukamurella sp. NPDC003166]|uniref:hypothetical protein n=1 Tax=Tsukamurella sp. NPDC003166 TaxID=3154444 RepID=UPI0033BD0D26